MEIIVQLACFVYAFLCITTNWSSSPFFKFLRVVVVSVKFCGTVVLINYYLRRSQSRFRLLLTSCALGVAAVDTMFAPAAAPIYCPGCRNALPADAAFCDRCGSRLRAPSAQNPIAFPEPVRCRGFLFVFVTVGFVCSLSPGCSLPL